WIHAQRDARAAPCGASARSDTLYLFHAFELNRADARGERLIELGVGLGDAAQQNVCGGAARGARQGANQSARRIRLYRVGDEVRRSDGCAEAVRFGDDRVDVVDVGR